MQPTTSSSSNMAPSSWKTLTASSLASFKEYVVQKDYKATYEALSSRVRGHNQERQTWGKWTPQTPTKPYSSSTDLHRMSMSVEKLHLFPGWAVRRYADPAKPDLQGAEFTLDVYVSGFASSVRPPEAATRSQKAFYRIAKSYAALPKLPTLAVSPDHPQHESTVPTDFFISKNHPNPDELKDESELATLDAHLQQMTPINPSFRSSDEESEEDQDESSNGLTTQDPRSYDLSQISQPPAFIPSKPTHPPERIVNDALYRLHANLDARLQPFWSNAIPNRLVRLSVFCPHAGYVLSGAQKHGPGKKTDCEPVATLDVITNPQGSFQATFNVPWERLATHPPTLHLAFGEPEVEYPVVIQAEMWPTLPQSLSSSNTVPYLLYQRSTDSGSQQHLSTSCSSLSSSLSESYMQEAQCITNCVTISLSTPHIPIRLISDIDDTVKHAGVLQGAKTVFRNVFVRRLEELVIPNMVEWYQMLWQRGVRFHYVSNSPFELLPVLNEFFRISSLPNGSIKLKSYAARSLLPALLSPPASRKRQGVVEVLDAFPESRFILVGDSGEQDMELYAELARERPNQVVAVFIRDVTTDVDQLAQTKEQVGPGAMNAQFFSRIVDREPEPISMLSQNPLATSVSSIAPASDSSSHLPVSVPRGTLSFVRSPPVPITSPSRSPGAPPRRKSSAASMTPEEKRRYELNERIERARGEIPRHITFRVFRGPKECVEVEAILTTWLGNTRR